MLHVVLAWMLVLSGTFEQAGFHAVHDLLQNFYAGGGKWRTCDQTNCSTATSDWGVDTATYTLYLRWTQTHNPEFAQRASELLEAGPRYGGPCMKGPCSDWSDTPGWDAVASMREFSMLRDERALDNAKTALRYVEGSAAFLRGACPSIPFQHPPQEQSRVKTLESTANVVKADLLVYEATHDESYLRAARNGYDSARRYYLDAQLPLYTVHVIDDGFTCSQVPHRFFASVNGDMIWNGMELWRLTGERHFADEALLTAHAVDTQLSDGTGVFANMQGDNDVVEPLVEAMLDLAQRQHLDFARNWILRNANAALASRTADGSFPRFFDGPSQTMTSIWEANGGLSLEIAAAQLAPDEVTQAPAPFDESLQTATITSLPATIEVDGSAIALVGTITPLCEKGHVRVLIDGVETTDQTGLWQNKSMPHGSSVLFAWRWPRSGHHVVALQPGDTAAATPNALSVSSVFMR